MADNKATFIEHRRSRRTRIRLRGRCLLADGSEHPCETIDVSVTGLAISAYVVAELRERIVAYIDELGRLEGVVTRRGHGWFAIDVKIPAARIDRLAQKLSALTGAEDLPNANTLIPQSRSTELRTEFGQTFRVQLCDQTRFGARVVADFKLLPGARVTVDRRAAVVVHDSSDGFLIDFN